MIPEDELTISKLRQSFALESQSNKQQHKQREALTFEKEKKDNNNKNNYQNKQKICYKCGMKNHISTDCRAPQYKIDKYKQQRKEEKNKNNSNQNENNNNSKNNNQNNQKKAQTSNVELAMSITESNNQ